MARWFVLILVLLIAGVGLWKYRHRPPNGEMAHPGPLDLCGANPAFALKYGMHPPLLIDTRQNDGPGLRLMEARKGGRVLQLDNWKQFGYLGPYALDKDGVIYTAPIPFVNLGGHEPGYFNRILRLDPASGQLEDWMTLPSPAPATEDNAYGVTGLAYDCTTHTLYVASVAGSDANHERGRIYHIDLKTKRILHRLDHFDALGLGLYRMRAGKRLYLGHARSPEVFSIGLKESGGFRGRKPKFEFSLAAFRDGSYDNAHRIRFTRDGRMIVKGIEFNFSLMAASDPQRNIYLLRYRAEGDKWEFVDVQSQQE